MVVKILEQYKKWIMCILMMMCCVWIACHQHIYADVDNYFIAMVENGLYSNGDNYVQHLHPLLSKCIFVLRKIIPHADCFSLLVRVMLIAGASWICYLLVEQIKYIGFACVASVCILILVNTGGIFCMNYTVFAAFLSCCGLFSIIVALFAKKDKVHIILWGTLFLCLGLMLRQESGLLIIPFFLLAITTEMIIAYCAGQKEKCVKLLKICTFPCMAIILVLISNQLFWVATGRADSIQYDANRVVIVDYPVKAWEEICELLPGISESDYKMVLNWNFADTEIMDAKFMSTVAKAAKITPQLNAMTLRKSNETILNTIRSQGVKIYSVWILALFLILLVLPSNKFERIGSLLAILGGYIIMLYLALKGRFPERACIAVCMPTIAILAGAVLKAAQRSTSLKPFTVTIITLVFLLVGSQFPNPIEFSKEFSPLALNAGESVDESTYREIYESNDIYLCGGSKTMAFAGRGKLPPTEFLKHYVSFGDWTYGQKYQNERLNSLGISNPIKALITRDNTYLITGDCSIVLCFLREHYAPNTEVRQIGEFEGEAIWEFYIP